MTPPHKTTCPKSRFTREESISGQEVVPAAATSAPEPPADAGQDLASPASSDARDAASLPAPQHGGGSVAVASPAKETRDFDGTTYVLERSVTTDFALVRASKGDRHGNLVFDKTTANFNPLCAMAGRITIAEVEELVDPGGIDPNDVHLPGIFVQRVIVVGSMGDKPVEKRTIREEEPS
ncbi:CoA-transferase [Micromonospora parva]|uniref:CoA transferase subunit A n=1 Tax=Micromonospora parva TaxID=1464048 RepID=UPI0033CC4F59